MASHAVSNTTPAKAARGIALVVLELVALAYLVMLMRGDWPTGHPWTAVAGGLGVASLLVAEARMAAVLTVLALVVGGAGIALALL